MLKGGKVKGKFVRVQGHPALRITACAVSKMAGVDQLPKLENFKDFLVEPNQKWLENPADEWAWVKVYYDLYGKVDYVSKTVGRVQVVKIPMSFLGESYKECWAEVQLCIKRQIIRNHNPINLEKIALGRHTCYDTRIGKWVEETKPIVPKKEAGKHGYIVLRLYHLNYLPENQPDWFFASLFVSIAGKDFYRIDAIWQNEEITITATQLYNDSSEIPKFLKQ